MVRRDGAETRRQRINEISQALIGIGQQGISLSKFVALQMVKTGLTKAKILEYLQILQEIGSIIIDPEVDVIREATNFQ